MCCVHEASKEKKFPLYEAIAQNIQNVAVDVRLNEIGWIAFALGAISYPKLIQGNISTDSQY